MTIALATAETLSEVDLDREPLSEALSEAGIDFEWHAWDEPIDWHRFDLVLIRSTWDYVRRIEAFSRWVNQCGDRLVNPAKLVTWNLHKGYLNELSLAGVGVVPTRLIHKGDNASLTQAASKMDSDYVIKPAVSAGSFGTYKCAQCSSPPSDCLTLLAERDLLIQPYPQIGRHLWRAFTDCGGRRNHPCNPKSATVCIRSRIGLGRRGAHYSWRSKLCQEYPVDDRVDHRNLSGVCTCRSRAGQYWRHCFDGARVDRAFAFFPTRTRGTQPAGPLAEAPLGLTEFC